MSKLGMKPNLLETEKIEKLLIKFCIPALASNLVTALYNIVDQIFIGNVLGVVGNAATNVVFPAVTLISALSLMCGVGSSNAMNLHRGNGEFDEAKKCVGGGFGLMILCGLLVTVPLLLWTQQLLVLFGCTETVMPYAMEYARITSLSFVCAVIGAEGTFLIRADGSPNFSLACIVTGSLVNVALDALFIFGFGWGIRGAAWATFLAETLSAVMVLWYLRYRFQSFALTARDFKPDGRLYLKMAAIGAGPAFNFGTQAIVQIFLNNALRIYGETSVYGSDICLAVAGVASKVNTLASAMIVGLTNGLQPIASYNYGKKNYARVAKAAKKVVSLVFLLGWLVFLCYQLFSVQITAFFGEGNALYYEFAGRFFRMFYLLIGLFGLQTSVAGFFSAQGKVKQSITISLVRQVLFFPPLLVFLPRYMGLDGVLWAGPVSDLAMALVAGTLFFREIKKLES